MTTRSRLKLLYDNDPIDVYVASTQDRKEWANSTGSIRSWIVTDKMRAVFDADRYNVMKDHLTEASRLAWLTDEPDYVITYRMAPIAWHATTRGIAHRSDSSSHQWVLAELQTRFMDKAVWRKHYARCRVIVTTLNDRIAAKNAR